MCSSRAIWLGVAPSPIADRTSRSRGVRSAAAPDGGAAPACRSAMRFSVASSSAQRSSAARTSGSTSGPLMSPILRRSAYGRQCARRRGSGCPLTSPEVPMATLAVPEALNAAVRRSVIAPDDPDYDERRALYNAMIDKRPALIARCTDAADVIAAIGHARSTGMPLAVRGGGHNGGGLGSVDDGIVLDLSGMRGVLVDPKSRVARVLGGSLWGAVDHATHAFGLATPTGIISTTGVGGLTLGGGVGHLTRPCGLAI